MGQEERETKKCHFCGEEILAAAIKCKHCGSMLDAAPEPLSVQSQHNTYRQIAKNQSGTSWAFVGAIVVAALAITNPSEADFVKYFTDKKGINKKTDQNSVWDSLASGIATFALSKMSTRSNYLIFSVHEVDTSILRAFGKDLPNIKFLGVLGNFIPLSGYDFQRQDSEQLSSEKESGQTGVITDSNNLPTKESAFIELFNVFNKSGKTETASGELTSIWFEKTFKYGSDDIHVKFFKTQDGDECHACGVKVGFVSYKHINGQWQVTSKQQEFSEEGQWGDVGDEKPEIMKLSTDVVALLIDYGGVNMGQSYNGKILYTFAGNSWHNAGGIATSENNSGDCEPSLSTAGKDRMRPCWGYEGPVSIVAGISSGHPNLLVTRTGTEIDESDKLVPARNRMYVFKDGTYSEIKK